MGETTERDEDDDTEVITIRVPRELKRRLLTYAQGDERTLSSLVRKVLKHAVGMVDDDSGE